MGPLASSARRAMLTCALVLGLTAQAAQAAETTQYTYDALGRVVSAIDQSGKKVAYTYDSAGNRTRVSNGAEFTEITPTAFTASSNAGTTGLTATNGMRDGGFTALASIHATNSESGPWIKADLGSVKTVNHIEIAPAIESTVGAGLDDLNDTVVEYSLDNSIWKAAATVSGVTPNATRSISLGGVALRYLRIRRTLTGQVALGDLRFYSAAASNSPLIAEPDSITSMGSAVTFDPRTNDRDLDGQTIAISSAEDPPHGTVTVNSGVSLTYAPDAGYFGADSFLYTVADGHNGTASARVSVIVQSSTNHAPVAVNDQFNVSDRATAVVDGINTLRPLNNDYDADGDVLTITGTTAPSHGAISVVGSNIIEYQPTVSYTGSDSFTYTISDGRSGTSTATVSVATGNTNPIAAADNVVTARGAPITIDPRLNDSDPNGDAITITSITSAASGAATLNGNQTVTYAPNIGFVGVDGLTYALSDGRGGTATGAIAIAVAPNSPPVAIGDSISATAATPVTFDPRTNDSDPENRPLTVVAVTVPSHGAAVIASAGAAVTYTSSSGYSGADSFIYTLSNDQGATSTALVAVNSLSVDYFVVAGGGGGSGNVGGGGGAGGVLQGSAPITIGSTSIAVGSGGAASASGNAGNGTSSSVGSLASATGGGGGGSYTGSAGAVPSGGSGGGAGGYSGRTGGSGASGQGFKGGDQTLVASAGGGGGAGGGGQNATSTDHASAGGPGLNSSFGGTPVNYAAGGGGGGYTDYDTTYIVFGAAGGSSASAGVMDGTPVAAAANRGGGGGGGGPGGIGGSGIVMLRYLGAPKATGGTITQVGGYTIHTFTAAGTFSVTSTNSGPTAVNDSITAASGLALSFDPRTNDTDPNGDGLLVAAVGAPSHGTATRNASGSSVTYTATLGYTGSDSFTYTLSDGQGLTSTATVSVTVTGGVAIEYLVGGGGGGGGRNRGGGGGGGNVLSGGFLIASGSYAISLGAGGAGGSSDFTPGANGGSSSISTLLTALGGGGGASKNGPALSTGANGGGGSYPSSAGGGSAIGGHAGGAQNSAGGGGGGGVAANGDNALGQPGGYGGGGVSSSLPGTATTYGAGGGGGALVDLPSSKDWLGGGGGDSSAGAGSTAAGTAAPANRGGGGGGGGLYIDMSYASTPSNGGAGGSGVVIIRYLTGAMTATGGTITTSGSYRVHTFTSGGTFVVP